MSEIIFSALKSILPHCLKFRMVNLECPSLSGDFLFNMLWFLKSENQHFFIQYKKPRYQISEPFLGPQHKHFSKSKINNKEPPDAGLFTRYFKFTQVKSKWVMLMEIVLLKPQPGFQYCSARNDMEHEHRNFNKVFNEQSWERI